jgi:transposase
MAIAVGIDVAKENHWACVKVKETGQLLHSRRVRNDPTDIQDLIETIDAAAAEHGPAVIALDLLGGIAGLIQAMLHDAGLHLVHVPGLAVNRARRSTRGGERKSDPKDAEVIADQIRIRDDLRPITEPAEIDVELRLLVGRRRELVTDATRRQARIRDLLTSIFPGLERHTDVTTKVGLWLLTRYATPEDIRAAGRAEIQQHLAQAGKVKAATIEALTAAALAAAETQRVAVPGQAVTADLIHELAGEGLEARAKLAELDKRIEAVLERHPDAALIRSLPGMGATLTAEFLAEAGGTHRFPTPGELASAAGLAPVLKQSGKVHYLQRATAGNKALKRVFYQSAFCAIQRDPASRTYYQRKRTEGKRHHQALISLARRRINVLHAILRTRTPYNPNHRATAA